MLKALKFSYIKEKFIEAEDAAFFLTEKLETLEIETVPFFEENLVCIIVESDKKNEVISCLDNNLKLISETNIENENWIKKCSDILTDIEIGNIIIKSCLDNSTKKNNQNEILIKAGTGFGTGHHPTTLMLLEELITNKELYSSVNSACDFGTGSGILAIVFNLLYKKNILAIDNDELALENARENLKLNDCKNIEIKNLDNLEESNLDLIIANLYSELLITLKTKFYDSLNENAHILVSGILNEQIEQVKLNFLDIGFSQVKHKSKKDSNNNTWHAILFTKS